MRNVRVEVVLFRKLKLKNILLRSLSSEGKEGTISSNSFIRRLTLEVQPKGLVGPTNPSFPFHANLTINFLFTVHYLFVPCSYVAFLLPEEQQSFLPDLP